MRRPCSQAYCYLDRPLTGTGEGKSRAWPRLCGLLTPRNMSIYAGKGYIGQGVPIGCLTHEPAAHCLPCLPVDRLTWISVAPHRRTLTERSQKMGAPRASSPSCSRTVSTDSRLCVTKTGRYVRSGRQMQAALVLYNQHATQYNDAHPQCMLAALLAACSMHGHHTAICNGAGVPPAATPTTAEVAHA